MPAAARPQAERSITLQLNWYPRFQHAGYYVADALGYYKDAGLHVTIASGGYGISPFDRVANNQAQFGVGGADLLAHVSNGKPLVSLAAIFQHSRAAIAVPEGSAIFVPSDLVGKRVAVNIGSSSQMQFETMLRQEGIDPRRVQWVKKGPNLSPLLHGEVTGESVYITTAPFELGRRHFAYRFIRPLNYGVDFYGDCLFTRANLVSEQPELVSRFRQASLKGWQFALEHQAQAVDIMLADHLPGLSAADRSALLEEARESAKLINPDAKEIGFQNPDRWARIQEYLQQLGKIDHPVDVDDFVYNVRGAPSNRELTWRVEEARYLLALATLVVLFYLLYSWSLRRAIRRKTFELETALADLESRKRILQALLELSRTLTASRGAEAVTEQIVQQIRSGAGFDRVGIYLVDEELRELRGVVGVDDQGNIEDCRRYIYRLDDRESPIVQVALGERDYYYTEDAARSFGSGDGKRHNAFVPLRTAGRVLGVIAVDNLLTGRPFGQDAVRALRGFADEMALAIHNSRLLARGEEQQKTLEQRNRELSALVAFGAASTIARTLDSLVQVIWHTVRDGLGFDRIGIFLKDGDLIRGVIGTDEDGGQIAIPHEAWPVDSSSEPWPSVMRDGQEYAYSSNAAEEYGTYSSSGRPIREHILVLMRTQEQVIGAIAVDNLVTGRPIHEEDARPLLAYARQAATALQNVMLLEALQSSEERLRMLVTSLTETLYSARVAANALVPFYYSPRIEELTGYTVEDALRGPEFWVSLVHPDDRSRYIDALTDIMLGGAKPIEYRIVHRSGGVRWVLDTPAPARDDSGAVIRISGALLDITERKQLEEGLRRAQKMETVGTLAGGVAHEFNNLLGIILGNVQLAQLDAGEDNPAQHSLAQSRKAIERAAELTKQLLTFSAKMESRREPVHLEKVIGETVGLLKSSLGKNIRLSVDVAPNLEPVSADAGQLQQVLINLCVNARDAMPNGGSIQVHAAQTEVYADRPGRPEVAPTGRYVMVSVSDTGTGMDAHTQERIFEPFFTTKPVGRGTGLGLAVAYGIIAEHRGWMEVQSAPGQGTTFRIYLPTAAAIAAQPLPEEGLPPTALVVEASPSARAMLVDILEELGYATLTAATASEALAIFWTDADMVDLVVSDSHPAGMDVGHLIANFRDFKPEVPILIGMPSGNGASPDLSGLEASVVRKPYDATEIARVTGLSLVNQPAKRDTR